MYLLIRWFFSALLLLAIAQLVPGIDVTGVYPALIAALMLGLVNALIRPILVVLTLPVTIVTLGLFALVINALLFWFVASFIQGFTVAGFAVAFIGALIMAIGGWILNALLKKK